MTRSAVLALATLRAVAALCALSARDCRPQDPVCNCLLPCRFHLHRLFNVLAVLSATAGIIIAWIKFDSIDSVGTVGSAHKAFAYLAWILIIILPIAGIIRPKKPEPGLKSSKLRLMWEIGHKGLGCALGTSYSASIACLQMSNTAAGCASDAADSAGTCSCVSDAHQIAARGCTVRAPALGLSPC